MKTKITLALCGSLLAAITLRAQVPQLINYQGRVAVGGTNFDGAGQFRFALVNSNGTVTFWSNDGTSVAGSQPTASVALAVHNGLYAVLLGDATLPGMTAISSSVFTNLDVRLRVWFNDGVAGSQLLSPDQRIAAVGYAMMAANVPDGVITSTKIADGSISANKIADGTITGAKLAAGVITSASLSNSIALGNASNSFGRLDVYRTSADTPAVSIIGSASQISTYGSDGQEQTKLWGVTYGELLLNNSLANNANAVTLSANGSSGGFLALKNTNGANRAYLSGGNAGGSLSLYQADGSVGAFLDGDNSGYGLFNLRSTNGSTRAQISGGPASGSMVLNNKSGVAGLSFYNYGDDSGVVSVRNAAGAERGYFWGANGAGGGELSVKDNSGTTTILMQGAESASAGSQILMYQADGTQTIELDAEVGAGGGGYLGLKKGDGTQTITLQADSSGSSKITTQVLQITGGSDLSEQFDINSGHDALKPGMIVSIDAEHPGELALSREAFDKKVAGVISGAGGVKTGMLMGQTGSKADGKHAVALTGRVFCWVDADAGGAIAPGDLITTSDTPGHGMKAGNDGRGSGALIGKAMSSLPSGKGLVLVLVSLQ